MIRKQKNNSEKKSRLFPLYLYFIWGILAISIVVYIASLISEPFADFYNRYPGALVRALLAYATNLLPLSLTEIILICSPAIVTAAIIYIIK